MGEAIKKTAEQWRAIGHFNFAELTVIKVAMAAAGKLSLPVILGVSEGERDFLGPELIKKLLPLKSDFNIFFNADHTKSLLKVKEAVEIGYDAILFDGSDLPLEENIRKTKEAVEYVKSVNPQMLVEGEIGYIGSGSKVHERVPEGIELTSVEDAVRFVKETGVDLLAPAVGNIHGVVQSGEPRLDIERIKAIAQAVKVPLVLHGASGNSDEDIKAAIKAGVRIVHVNTEIRVAWRNALAEFLKTNPQEIAPYKILAPAAAAAREVIERKLQLFGDSMEKT